MYCPHCGNTKKITVNLFSKMRKSLHHGDSNEIQATCRACNRDFGMKYTLKVINGQVILSN